MRSVHDVHLVCLFPASRLVLIENLLQRQEQLVLLVLGQTDYRTVLDDSLTSLPWNSWCFSS